MNLKKLIELAKTNVVKNGVWMYLLQFFNTIIPLITLPYITRVLGPTKYGFFTIILNIVTYIQVFIEYSYELSASREISLQKDNSQDSIVFTKVFSSRFLLFLVAVVGTVIYLCFWGTTAERNICFGTMIACLFGYVFQVNWLFQGKQDMKFISIANIIARTITTVLVFIFIKGEDDIILYCVLYSISTVISNFISVMIAAHKYKIRLVKIKFKDTLSSLKGGLNIFFTIISAKICGAIGVTFLGIYSTEAMTGIYSAIYKIPYVMMLLWTPISQVLYPLVSKKITENFFDGIAFVKKIRNIFLLIFTAISVVIGVLGRWVVLILFGEDYVGYFYIIYPLLLWVILGIYNNFLGVQIMIGSGHNKEYRICFEIDVLISVLANFCMVYFFDIVGASLAPMIAELSLSIMLFFMLRRIEKKEKEKQVMLAEVLEDKPQE